MRQGWEILNLDLVETLGHPESPALGQWLFTKFPHGLLCNLAAPRKFRDYDSMFYPFQPGKLFSEADRPSEYAPPDLLRRAMYFPQTACQSRERIALVNLPVELIHEIYMHLDDMLDAIYLSMTCQALWEIGRRDLHHRMEELAAAYSWAGDRIICIGYNTSCSALPENLVTQDEMDKFEWDDHELLFRTFKKELYDFHLSYTMGFHLFPSYRRRLDPRESAPYIDTLALAHLHYHQETELVPTDVLRNLSKHEYVRELAMIDLQVKYVGTHVNMDMLTLGHVLVCRICCSSDPSVSMPYDGEIHRGVWVGDRFDTIGAEWLAEKHADWTDVSEEVLAEVEAIWNAKFPPPV